MDNRTLHYHNPDSIFNPNPYGFSHSVAMDTPAKICYVSGQSGGIGRDHQLEADFRSQVKDALSNLCQVLEGQGMCHKDVVKITLLIVDNDADKLEQWTTEAHQLWGEVQLPASTLIPVQQLALPGMLFEIDAVAIKGVNP